MIQSREKVRSEARRVRLIVRRETAENATSTRDRVASTIGKARTIVAHQRFGDTLRQAGIHSVPQCLSDTSDHAGNTTLDEVSVRFVIAWTFLFPLFSKPPIRDYLEDEWPGFIAEMKDAFIQLVVDGPFPFALSGHRGRRRGYSNLK
jgi:hypothetical protein